MTLPQNIEAHLLAKFPRLPDVSSAVAKRAWWYANDWPFAQTIAGLYRQELVRAGVAVALAEEASLVVQLVAGGFI